MDVGPSFVYLVTDCRNSKWNRGIVDFYLGEMMAIGIPIVDSRIRRKKKGKEIES